VSGGGALIGSAAVGVGAGVLLPAAGAGLVGGALVGMTGVGAGSVIAAALLMLFPDVAPQVIVGSATIQAVAMKCVGVAARRQFRLREGKLGVAMAAGAIPFAVAGAWASSAVPGETLRSVLALVLAVVGVLLVIQAMAGEAGSGGVVGSVGPSTGGGGAAAGDPSPARVGSFGAAVGFIAGLTSVGTGTLFVSALAGPLRVDAHRAVAAALVAGVLTLVVSGATHALLGHFDVAIVLGTVLGSIPGVLFGTAMSHRLPARALRGAIGAGIAIAAIVSMARIGK
jgi:uncharacterized membrane protein YfcA